MLDMTSIDYDSVYSEAAHSEPRRDEIIVIEVVYATDIYTQRLMFSMFMSPTLKKLMGHIAF